MYCFWDLTKQGRRYDYVPDWLISNLVAVKNSVIRPVNSLSNIITLGQYVYSDTLGANKIYISRNSRSPTRQNCTNSWPEQLIAFQFLCSIAFPFLEHKLKKHFPPPLVGRIEVNKARLNFWDLGGQRDLHSIWEKYYAECHAIVFVMDATAKDRIEECKEVFG